MNEDQTRSLPDARSFEERVLEQLASINTRLSTIEDKVERRRQETRPIWEAVQSQLASLQEQFSAMQEKLIDIDEKLGILNGQILDMRADHGRLKKRVSGLEQERVQ